MVRRIKIPKIIGGIKQRLVTGGRVERESERE